MAPTGKPGRSKQLESTPSLSEQGHKQIVDYLRLAEKSQHPEIRKMALQLAKQTSTYEQQQQARVSPSLIMWINIALALTVVLACWYAFLHYSQGLAWEVTAISLLVFLVLVAISLSLAGRLSEQGLMTILQWLWLYVRGRFKSLKPPSDSNRI